MIRDIKVQQPIIIRYKVKSNVKLVDLNVSYSENRLCISSDTLDVKPTLNTYDEVFLCLVTNFSNLSSVSWRIEWILFVVNAQLEATR